jgi:hypothetical protein
VVKSDGRDVKKKKKKGIAVSSSAKILLKLNLDDQWLNVLEKKKTFSTTNTELPVSAVERMKIINSERYYRNPLFSEILHVLRDTKRSKGTKRKKIEAGCVPPRS